MDTCRSCNQPLPDRYNLGLICISCIDKLRPTGGLKFDAGKLTYGVSDPNSASYNSLADFCAGDGVIELRIPWLLFNVRDPGTKNIIAD